MSETGEPLNGQLTHNLPEWQLFGLPDNKSERLCTLPQGAKGYPIASAGWSGRKQGKKARKQRDDENFFHFIFTRQSPPNVCVALNDLCGFPCIIGEVEIEYG